MGTGNICHILPCKKFPVNAGGDESAALHVTQACVQRIRIDRMPLMAPAPVSGGYPSRFANAAAEAAKNHKANCLTNTSLPAGKT